MRKASTYLTAGALCVFSVGAAPPSGAFGLPRAERAEVRRERDEAKYEAKQGGLVRKMIAITVDRGLSDDGITDVLKGVESPDRVRIERNLRKADEAAYTSAAQNFHATWNTKYGSTFDADAHTAFLDDAQVVFEQEGQRAIVTFPAAGDVQPFVVHLQRNRLGEWRIDLPDSVSAQTFESNMLAAVRNLNGREQKLPADVNQAYKEAAAEILHPLAYSE